MLSLEFSTEQVTPEVGAFAIFKDEISCLNFLDERVKQYGFKYKINSLTGEKYISKVEKDNNIPTEMLGFCKKIATIP
jgi:hypothetical protein